VALAPGRTDRDTAVDELGHGFKGAFAAVRRLRGRQAHRPGELSHAQYQLLFELQRGGQLAAGELATCADLSAATVTQMLDQLAREGLVERARSAEDRRIVVSRLTPEGVEACAARHAQIEPMWRAALERFDETELRAAAAVLTALGDMFDRLDAQL
jgi:DNA-binding MarR family transcriptional regulator